MLSYDRLSYAVSVGATGKRLKLETLKCTCAEALMSPIAIKMVKSRWRNFMISCLITQI